MLGPPENLSILEVWCIAHSVSTLSIALAVTSAILHWQETIIALLVLGDICHPARLGAVSKLRKRIP